MPKSKKHPLSVVRIRNAVFYAYHGAMEDEQNLGGKFELDVEMHCDSAAAAKTDSLEKAVDYEKVYAFIRERVVTQKYYLLETLASTIARGIVTSFRRVQKVRVRVRKPHPPVKGVVDYVEVEVEEER